MPIIKEQVVVIGAGIAGCTAALQAAQLGLKVTLVDEHPQNTAAMSLDAPYFYGARLPAILSDEGAIADRVLGSNDLLMECLEAGVEVLTNTCAWGVFIPGQNNDHLECRQIGLADAEKSWMLGFDYLVVAAGARDLVLSFDGWHLPGVIGVKGATTLLGKYQALGGSNVLVLGSGNVALQFALQALATGISIAGIVEAAPEALGDSALIEQLIDQGVVFFTGQCIERALGTNEVSGAKLVSVDAGAAPSQEIACDTICMAYGCVPNVELLASAGASLIFDAERGGWSIPVNGHYETNLVDVFVVGDAYGVSEAALLDPGVAIAQAKLIATTIAIHSGQSSESLLTPEQHVLTTSRAVFPPDHWLKALLDCGGMDVTVCQCEEVSRSELINVQAPKYLSACQSSPVEAVNTLIAEGRASQDMLKRMTRAGMGHCQGRRCREHSSMLVAASTSLSLADVIPGSYRIPVRALPLNVIRDHQEPTSLRDSWPTWLHPVDESLPNTH